MMQVGLLGGSFNPIHNGHMRMALEALEQVPLDWVELVPAFIPPHKTTTHAGTFAQRCRFIELAIAQEPALRLNRMEGERSGPSYTADTLRLYGQIHPEYELHFILGCTDFEYLPEWHAWQRLPELTHFVVVGRSGHDMEALTRFVERTWPRARLERDQTWRLPAGSKVMGIDTPRLDISSTLIRDKLSRDQSVRSLVPDTVWAALKDDREN